jgi:hypothetical protein
VDNRHIVAGYLFDTLNATTEIKLRHRNIRLYIAIEVRETGRYEITLNLPCQLDWAQEKQIVLRGQRDDAYYLGGYKVAIPGSLGRSKCGEKAFIG